MFVSAHIAQLVEHLHGKQEVSSSTLLVGLLSERELFVKLVLSFV